MLDKKLIPDILNKFINYIQKNKEFTKDTVNNYSNDVYFFLRFIKNIRN